MLSTARCQLVKSWSAEEPKAKCGEILPDGCGGGVSPHHHPVLPLGDLLGPVRVQPRNTGHVTSIHHGHDPVLYTQLTGNKHTDTVSLTPLKIQLESQMWVKQHTAGVTIFFFFLMFFFYFLIWPQCTFFGIIYTKQKLFFFSKVYKREWKCLTGSRISQNVKWKVLFYFL